MARFDGRNPRAEGWLTERSSTLVVEIVDDQREAIRAAARDGMEAGRNPRETALDIVGRINRKTGRREGGIVGLTTQQAGWVQNAAAELQSGDPAQMAGYLERKARDRRFDPVVRRAIRDGKPVSAADVRKMVARYSDKLLKTRGDAIARTETLAALHAAQHEGLRQMVDAGNLRADQIERVWDSTGNDGRTRDSHLAMEGQATGLEGLFVTPAGHRLQYPGDTTHGAPGSETINCRCQVRVRINHFAGLT